MHSASPTGPLHRLRHDTVSGSASDQTWDAESTFPSHEHAGRPASLREAVQGPLSVLARWWGGGAGEGESTPRVSFPAKESRTVPGAHVHAEEASDERIHGTLSPWGLGGDNTDKVSEAYQPNSCEDDGRVSNSMRKAQVLRMTCSCVCVCVCEVSECVCVCECEHE